MRAARGSGPAKMAPISLAFLNVARLRAREQAAAQSCRTRTVRPSDARQVAPGCPVRRVAAVESAAVRSKWRKRPSMGRSATLAWVAVSEQAASCASNRLSLLRRVLRAVGPSIKLEAMARVPQPGFAEAGVLPNRSEEGGCFAL